MLSLFVKPLFLVSRLRFPADEEEALMIADEAVIACTEGFQDDDRKALLIFLVVTARS